MSKESHRSTRAALMLSAAMLVAGPVVAQTTAVAPPPVTTTVTPQTAAPQSVTPPPVTSTAPTTTSAAPSGGTSGDSPTRVNPDAAAQAAAEDAERRSAPRAERRAAPRAAAVTRTAAPRAATAAPAAAALTAAAPAATPATPAATAPAAETAAPATPTAAADEPAAAPAAKQQTTTQTEEGPPLWPLALIALLIVGAGAAWFLMRRPRATEEYEPVYAEEPVYVEPVHAEPVATRTADPVPPAAAVAMAGVMVDDHMADRSRHAAAEPVAEHAATPTLVSDAAPVAAETATVSAAYGDDVAALTAVDAPTDRPWLEFAMRPVRAGANVDEALVEIELTVANAGNLPAEDVRISTFMLPAGNDSEMERLLIERHDEAVDPIDIAAGEGTRVDATLATSRADLVNGAEHAAFQPVIVADARYRLPDGSEGRTSASFVVGTTSDGGATLEPLSLDRPDLREDVEARLYREPARV